jgi:hypothetical protein
VLFLRAVKRRIQLVLCVLSVCLLAGCGYTLLRHQRGSGDAQRVAVRGFSNDSFEPGVELVVTDALKREFLRRGEVRLVENAELADLLVGGAVSTLEIRRRSFDSISFTLEYEVAMALDLAIVKPDGSEIRLDSRVLRDTERYLASADVEVTRTNRDEAIRRLASVLAVRVHDVLTEPVTP